MIPTYTVTRCGLLCPFRKNHFFGFCKNFQNLIIGIFGGSKSTRNSSFSLLGIISFFAFQICFLPTSAKKANMGRHFQKLPLNVSYFSLKLSFLGCKAANFPIFRYFLPFCLPNQLHIPFKLRIGSVSSDFLQKLKMSAGMLLLVTKNNQKLHKFANF